MASEHVQTALLAHSQGFCVVPPKEDGTKAPIGTWAKYQRQRPSSEQLMNWYGPSSGVGLICGKVSGNLELLEFDDFDTYDAYKEAAQATDLIDLIDRLEAGYHEESPNGGIHWLYRRSDQVPGNTKLARRPTKEEEKQHAQDNVRVLIETRGEGGYVIIAPTNGAVHPSGKPYRRLSGSLETVITLTEDEHRSLWELAKSFDQMPRVKARSGQAVDSNLERPGDRFNLEASWESILEPHGWVKVYSKGDSDYWRRPGKTIGTSATTNYQDSGFLVVFSSSTEFEPERGYSKFSAFTLLEYNGDFHAAAIALRNNGYGGPEITEEVPIDAPVRQYPQTDYGNAERMVDLHGGDLRFVYKWGKWLAWVNRKWDLNSDGEVNRRAKMTVRRMYQSAGLMSTEASALADETDRKAEIEAAGKLMKWARTSEGRSRLEAMIAVAESELTIPVQPDELDLDPWLINCMNGTLDLRTGILSEHRRDDLITKLAPVAYDPDAQCPLFMQFLYRIMDDSEALVTYLQRAIGYSLTGMIGDHCLFVCYGRGRNGKSTFLDTFQGLLGDYSHKMPSDLLMVRRGESHPTELTLLYRVRFAPASETTEGRKLDETTVKDLTGGERITARRMREDFWQFDPTHHLWLATNHKPIIHGSDLGIWSRIKLIPFQVTIPIEERDPALWVKLRDEWAGILAWAVRGCLAWQGGGLQDPPEVYQATAEYHEQMDVMGDFVRDLCVEEQGARVSSRELYAAYQEWTKATGERNLRRIEFGQRLEERGYMTGRGTKGIRLWRGIRLKTNDEPVDEQPTFDDLIEDEDGVT